MLIRINVSKVDLFFCCSNHIKEQTTETWADFAQTANIPVIHATFLTQRQKNASLSFHSIVRKRCYGMTMNLLSYKRKLPYIRRLRDSTETLALGMV